MYGDFGISILARLASLTSTNAVYAVPRRVIDVTLLRCVEL